MGTNGALSLSHGLAISESTDYPEENAWTQPQ
jgi:hypothetical protein